MGNIVIKPEGLSEALDGLLKEYNKSVADTVKKESKSSMRKLVKETKATAPVGHRRSRHYKNSITSKTVYENSQGASYAWYVKGSDYRLSHLLEYGHATRNGGGQGHVEGTGFIKKASDPILESYVKKVEEVLKRG